MPTETGGETAASAALSTNGTSGAERRKRNSRTASSTAPANSTGSGSTPGSGVAAPAATVAELTSASVASNQMLRARRPGQMRARSPMRRAYCGAASPRVARKWITRVTFRMTSSRRPETRIRCLWPTRGQVVPRQIRPRHEDDPTETMMITVSGLTKQYGNRTVVDDVSFALEPGTVTGFLGPNGAGKTTTMRMMTGLVPATAGTALIDGTPYAALANPGAVVGTLLDASAVHPGLSGRTHLRLLADTVGVAWERVEEVLELVGLEGAAKRRISGYSLGMRQRLGIAGALLAAPPVLVFDEPANGLDPEGIRWMRDLLRHHAARGGTVLLSSHLLGEVEHTVDRLLVIGAGRIVADGSVASLLGSDGTVVRAVDPPALTWALD